MSDVGEAWRPVLDQRRFEGQQQACLTLGMQCCG